MASRLPPFQHYLESLGQDIWKYDAAIPLDLDALHESITCLQSQVKVQKSLQDTADVLLHHPSDAPLPNQRATRVKHMLRSVFEAPHHEAERNAKLRRLNCNALKFCALSFKMKDIMELTTSEFDFLLSKVEEFVNHDQLWQRLYRTDIDKAVNCKIVPHDDALFKTFLKDHIDARPPKRPSSDGVQEPERASSSEIEISNVPGCESSRPTKRRRTERVLERVTSHRRLDRQQQGSLSHSRSPLKENREMKHMYTNAPIDSISELPEPFRTAVQSS